VRIRHQRRHVWIIGLLVLSAAVSPLRRELFAGDETKYAQVIREMRSSGAFLLPTLNGEPFTHKPPVHFWMIALLTYVFGPYSIWPYVLPSLAAFALLLWIVARIERELIPESVPGLAVFACGTSVLVWGSAQSARMDVTFTALIAVGAWMLYRFFVRDDFRALNVAALALACATLIKGPMSEVIGLILFAIERWRRGRMPRGNYWPAIVILIAVPLLWFLPAVIAGGDAYASEVLEKQLAGRAVGAWVHKSPPWFYLLHAPGTLFPWFLPLSVALIAFVRRTPRRDAVAFFASWIAAVLLPYTLMSSKLDVYMMALVPAAALLIAGFAGADSIDRYARWGVVANQVTLILIAVVGVAGLTLAPRLVKPDDLGLATHPSVKGFFIVLIGASIVALWVGRRDLVRSTLAVGAVPLAALLYTVTVLMPLANDEVSTLRLIAAIERQNVAPSEVALFSCPWLWSRGMPRALESVRHAGEASIGDARVIIASRKHLPRIAPQLAAYRKVGEFRMIGKWFDVYRR